MKIRLEGPQNGPLKVLVDGHAIGETTRDGITLMQRAIPLYGHSRYYDTKTPMETEIEFDVDTPYWGNALQYSSMNDMRNHVYMPAKAHHGAVESLQGGKMQQLDDDLVQVVYRVISEEDQERILQPDGSLVARRVLISEYEPWCLDSVTRLRTRPIEKTYTYRTGGIALTVGDIVEVQSKKSKSKLATVVDIGSEYTGPTLKITAKHRHKFVKTCSCGGTC